MASGILGALLQIIAPARCAACRRFGDAICAGCLDRFARAALIIRSATPRMPPVFALGAYDGELRRAVHAFKFENSRAAGSALAAVLARKLPWAYDVVVPVPLHADRLRARGYNQAQVVATAVAGSLRRPMAADALRRIRPTAAQSALDAAAREINVQNAFAPGSQASALAARRVLLVDDVVTTGATIASCAGVLRECAAAAIAAATLAVRL